MSLKTSMPWRILLLMVVFGLSAGAITYDWMSRQPNLYRTNVTVTAVEEIRTPQESIQYFADLDGALRSFPVRSGIAEATGVEIETIAEGLRVSRVGSSSILRLSYESPDSDPEVAAAVLDEATAQGNTYLTNIRNASLEADAQVAEQELQRANDRLQTANAEVEVFIAANDRLDFERLALVEERVVVDLRVRVVTADAEATGASREAGRLRTAADLAAWDLELETAAVAAEVDAVNKSELADALAEELDTSQAAFRELSGLAAEQTTLQTELDQAQRAVDDLAEQSLRADIAFDTRAPSFTTEAEAPTFVVRDKADATRRALVAGASAAALVGLAALWWRSLVAVPKVEAATLERVSPPQALPTGSSTVTPLVHDGVSS